MAGLREGQEDDSLVLMAKSRRVRLQTDERRNQLLELGSELFNTRSYDEISIDEVAQIAGISKGLLYHYFGSKREFYVETIRAGSLRLRALTEPDTSLPIGQQLSAAIDRHLEYIRDHGKSYAALYRSGATIAPEVLDILEEHREVVMQRFLRALEIPKPKPALRTALRAWIALVENLSLDWIAHRALPPEALRELLVAAYVALLERAQQIDAKSVAKVARRST